MEYRILLIALVAIIWSADTLVAGAVMFAMFVAYNTYLIYNI